MPKTTWLQEAVGFHPRNDVIESDEPVTISWGTSGAEMQRYCIVREAQDEAEALGKVMLGTPHFWDTTGLSTTHPQDSETTVPTCLPYMWRTNIELVEDTMEREGYWHGTVTYQSPRSADDEKLTISTTGATTKRYHGILVQNINSAGGTGPSFGGQIPQGADVVVPHMNISITKALSADHIASCTNLGAYYGNTGATNSVTWKCFSPGEVIFKGVDIESPWQQTNQAEACSYTVNPASTFGPVTVTGKFETSPNYAFTFGGSTVIKKHSQVIVPIVGRGRVGNRIVENVTALDLVQIAPAVNFSIFGF